MKKYIRPTTKAICFLHECQLLAGSDVVHDIDGNAEIGYGGEGGDNDEAHAQGSSVWDTEW